MNISKPIQQANLTLQNFNFKPSFSLQIEGIVYSHCTVLDNKYKSLESQLIGLRNYSLKMSFIYVLI